MPPNDRSAIARALRTLAVDAGEAILALYARDAAGGTAVRAKADASPLTEADLASSNVILAGLPAVLPGVPVVCEETESDASPTKVGGTFVLVDPLDGTKEYIARTGEFTVNIALVVDGAPVAGVVYAPAVRRLFYGAREESGAGAAFEETEGREARPIRVRRPDAAGLVVVASRSHRDAATDAYIQAFPVKSFASAGSSLKFCMVAAAEADLYPRLGRTMEWDTAAGQSVLEAAGGSVRVLSAGAIGEPLRYGKPGFENPHFVAQGTAR